MSVWKIGFYLCLAGAYLAGCVPGSVRHPKPLSSIPPGSSAEDVAEEPPVPSLESFPEAPDSSLSNLSGLSSEVPSLAPALSPDLLSGVWKVLISGKDCKIATPQTRYGTGFRAGPLGCTAPLDRVKSWNVSGKHFILYDEDGIVLAQLYQAAEGRLEGYTSNGQPVFLIR